MIKNRAILQSKRTIPEKLCYNANAEFMYQLLKIFKVDKVTSRISLQKMNWVYAMCISTGNERLLQHSHPVTTKRIVSF